LGSRFALEMSPPGAASLFNAGAATAPLSDPALRPSTGAPKCTLPKDGFFVGSSMDFAGGQEGCSKLCSFAAGLENAAAGLSDSLFSFRRFLEFTELRFVSAPGVEVAKPDLAFAIASSGSLADVVSPAGTAT